MPDRTLMTGIVAAVVIGAYADGRIIHAHCDDDESVKATTESYKGSGAAVTVLPREVIEEIVSTAQNANGVQTEIDNVKALSQNATETAMRAESTASSANSAVSSLESRVAALESKGASA